MTSTANGYGAAYDSAGDMTCRAPAGSGKTCSGTPTGQPMTYDALRRLLTWQNAPSSPTSTTSNAYDGEGERVAQTVTSGGTTTTTEYCSTLMTKVVIVSGTLSYLVNDDLGSVSVALSASGTVTAAQLFAPYGTSHYSTGTMPTSYGFTGQRLDASGLNYFNARFYDAGVGLFTTADLVQGPNRYAYAGDNPATHIDPLGTDWWNDFWNTVTSAGGAALDFTFNFSGMGYDLSVVGDGSASFGDRFLAGADFALNLVVDGTIVADGADLALCAAGDLVARLSLSEAEETEGMAARGGPGKPLPELGANAPDLSQNPALINDVACGAGGNSFAAETAVATPEGEKPIGQMQVGNQVLAYDTTTGQSKAETVDHVFINHDTNLLDVTLAPLTTDQDASLKTTPTTTTTPDQQSTSVSLSSPTETLHTTTEHPFLTTDRGVVNAQNLQVGERVQELDGHIGVVLTPGAAVQYNLTVHELHTYAVGADRWVVHNCTPEEVRQWAQNVDWNFRRLPMQTANHT